MSEAVPYDVVKPMLTPVGRIPAGFGMALAPPLTSFLGREPDVAAVTALLVQDGRLVTLVGPGGVGKTRLALAVATDLYGTFRHGAACVGLAAVAEPEGVMTAIASALGVHERVGVDVTSAVADWIAGKDMLLVLDNFEHVIPAAPRVQELLARCPHLTVLVTSRTPLRISAERTVVVEPLPLLAPVTQDTAVAIEEIAANPAVGLYRDRALAVDPRFALTAANVSVIVDVCRRLDGLPLAIELAAAHSSVLSPAAMLARLDKRLQLLSGGPSDQPARLQTIRDTIAWSYDLLSPAAQRLFRVMAVFSGGARLAACEAVCPAGPDDPAFDILAALRELVDQQLVTRTDETADEPRFGMLQSILAFANEQLDQAGDRDLVARRHAESMLAFVTQFKHEFERNDRQQAWLRRFETEFGNLRAAFEWLLASGDPRLAIRLATWSFRGWQELGRTSEGIAWVSRALEQIDDRDSPEGLHGLTTLGSLSFLRGDYEQALHYAELSRQIAIRTGADDDLASSLVNLGAIHNHRGEGHKSAPYWDEALAIRRKQDDLEGIATIQNNWGILEVAHGDLASARQRLTEAYRCWQRTGSKTGLCSVTVNLAQLAIVEEDFPLARQLLNRSLALAKALDDAYQLSWAYYALGVFLVDRGEYEAAVAPLIEAFEKTSEYGIRYDFIAVCDAFFMLAARTGRGNLAATIAGYVEHERALANAERHEFDRPQYEQDVTAARASVPAKEFAAAWRTGALLGGAELLAELQRGLGGAASPPPDERARPAEPSVSAVLSARELEVLRLLVDGRADKEISELLFISRKTASQHVSSILRKLEVANRASAIAVAFRQGIS